MIFEEPTVNIKREENKQISLFDCDDTTPLPPYQFSNDTKKKSRGTKGKSKSKLSGNVTESKRITQISLDSIKTVESKNKTENGVGTIAITNNIKGNTFLASVSEKTKTDIENRNRELMRIREHPYIKKTSLMTEAEKKLYKFLKSRLDNEIIIFSKVRLGDIVELNEAITRETKAFLKIAYKHVDFCIMSPDLDLICVVELDDYTHDTAEAIRRDQFVAEVLRDCNIPLYRIKCRIDCITAEDTRGIEMCILEFMAPTCPLCGRPMEPKESRQRHNFGHRFYGCMGFYETGKTRCMYTIDID